MASKKRRAPLPPQGGNSPPVAKSSAETQVKPGSPTTSGQGDRKSRFDLNSNKSDSGQVRNRSSSRELSANRGNKSPRNDRLPYVGQTSLRGSPRGSPQASPRRESSGSRKLPLPSPKGSRTPKSKFLPSSNNNHDSPRSTSATKQSRASKLKKLLIGGKKHHGSFTPREASYIIETDDFDIQGHVMEDKSSSGVFKIPEVPPLHVREQFYPDNGSDPVPMPRKKKAPKFSIRDKPGFAGDSSDSSVPQSPRSIVSTDDDYESPVKGDDSYTGITLISIKKKTGDEKITPGGDSSDSGVVTGQFMQVTNKEQRSKTSEKSALESLKLQNGAPRKIKTYSLFSPEESTSEEGESRVETLGLRYLDSSPDVERKFDQSHSYHVRNSKSFTTFGYSTTISEQTTNQYQESDINMQNANGEISRDSDDYYRDIGKDDENETKQSSPIIYDNSRGVTQILLDETTKKGSQGNGNLIPEKRSLVTRGFNDNDQLPPNGIDNDGIQNIAKIDPSDEKDFKQRSSPTKEGRQSSTPDWQQRSSPAKEGRRSSTPDWQQKTSPVKEGRRSSIPDWRTKEYGSKSKTGRNTYSGTLNKRDSQENLSTAHSPNIILRDTPSYVDTYKPEKSPTSSHNNRENEKNPQSSMKLRDNYSDNDTDKKIWERYLPHTDHPSEDDKTSSPRGPPDGSTRPIGGSTELQSAATGRQHLLMPRIQLELLDSPRCESEDGGITTPTSAVSRMSSGRSSSRDEWRERQTQEWTPQDVLDWCHAKDFGTFAEIFDGE